MKLKWQQAPVKTQWGDEMVVASVAIDKDHTVSLYCEREQTAKVEAMFAKPAQTDLEAVAADQAMTIALLRAEQPSQQQEPVGTVQCINGVTIGYLDVMQPVGTKLYTSLQPAQPRKPLPFNKEDMKGLDVNQRLGFKLGWKSAEAAHNIKENT